MITDNKLQQEFKHFIENHFEEGPNRDFAIQYSTFDRMDNNEWYFNYVDPSQSMDEGLYDIDVRYSKNKTNVEIYSWKGNHETFQLVELQNYQGKSVENMIYAIDLYPEYTPKNFKGSAFTRGGFIGWNYIKENDSE